MSVTTDGLRALASWLDSHPEFKPYVINVSGLVVAHDYSNSTADGFAAKARAIGGRWEKHPGDELFTLRQEVAPGVFAEITGNRESVCTRVVTGVREVEVTEPDPEAVEALPKVTRVERVEDVEWRCEPLLARADA